MSEAYSADGRYWFIEQEDGNVVLYDRGSGEWRPAWDRWSFEAAQQQAGGPPQNPPHPPPADDLPAQDRPIDQAPITGDLRLIKVDDGPFAPRMMSDRANAWVDGNTAYVFAGSRQTGGAQFYAVGLQSGHVTAFGSMVPFGGETEFWYWTPDGLVMIAEGPRLHRVNPFNGADEVVLDISPIPALSGHTLDQWHSSDDGSTHSATVKDAAYQKVGTVTRRHGKVEYWPAQGALDESQVSRNGRWVVIKEGRERDGRVWDDNRVIDLDSRETKWLLDQERALGHSDCGPDYIVGEADKPDPGAMVIRYLDRLNEAPRILAHTTNMGYVSTRAGKCLWSNETYLALVAMDGSGVRLLIEHGGGTGYDDRVKANLSPCGRVACYMVNGAVYLLVIP